jgi:hypothetical protein
MLVAAGGARKGCDVGHGSEALLIAAMDTHLRPLRHGIVLRLLFLRRQLSSQSTVENLLALLLLTLLLMLPLLDLIFTGGDAADVLLHVVCHNAFLSITTG